jgi:hypothetical protein
VAKALKPFVMDVELKQIVFILNKLMKICREINCVRKLQCPA